MLPPLLSLLLDCAKKTDQTVASISLGALVHLIEVGGHQFNDRDWDTLLKGIRCASPFCLVVSCNGDFSNTSNFEPGMLLTQHNPSSCSMRWVLKTLRTIVCQAEISREVQVMCLHSRLLKMRQ